jgi:negative regulator of sigma-B (phosphoserine phosphatase)
VTEAYQPLEWAIAAVPLRGETVSGDLALVERRQHHYVLAGIDGLGHGPEAAEAADKARRTIIGNLAEPLDALLVLCHEALTKTRGAAVTLARVDAVQSQISWVGVGNVEALLFRSSSEGTKAIDSPVLSGGIVGYQLPRLTVRSVQLQRGDLVILATDGVARTFTQSLRPSEDIVTIAQGILESCNKGNDDALVMVTRFRGLPDD